MESSATLAKFSFIFVSYRWFIVEMLVRFLVINTLFIIIVYMIELVAILFLKVKINKAFIFIVLRIVFLGITFELIALVLVRVFNNIVREWRLKALGAIFIFHLRRVKQ